MTIIENESVDGGLAKRIGKMKGSYYPIRPVAVVSILARFVPFYVLVWGLFRDYPKSAFSLSTLGAAFLSFGVRTSRR